MNKFVNFLAKRPLVRRSRKKEFGPVFKDDPTWVKHVPPGCVKRFRKKEELAEQKLFEERKQLFNSEKGRPNVSYWNEPGLIELRQKFNPDLPNPALKRLIPRCWQNMQEWKKEQEERDKKNINQKKEWTKLNIKK